MAFLRTIDPTRCSVYRQSVQYLHIIVVCSVQQYHVHRKNTLPTTRDYIAALTHYIFVFSNTRDPPKSQICHLSTQVGCGGPCGRLSARSISEIARPQVGDINPFSPTWGILWALSMVKSFSYLIYRSSTVKIPNKLWWEELRYFQLLRIKNLTPQ